MGNMLLIYGNIHSVGYDENIFYLHDITLWQHDFILCQSSSILSYFIVDQGQHALVIVYLRISSVLWRALIELASEIRCV